MADNKSQDTSNLEAYVRMQKALMDLRISRMMKENAIDKQSAKIAKEKIAEAQKELKVSVDMIMTKKGYIGDLKAENEASKQLRKTVLANKDAIMELVVAGKINREEFEKFNSTIESTGISTKRTSEEVQQLFNRFKKGDITFSKFWRDIKGWEGATTVFSSTISKLLSPLALATMSFKAMAFGLKEIYAYNSYLSSSSIAAGQRPTLAGKDRKVFEDYIINRFEAMGLGFKEADYRERAGRYASEFSTPGLTRSLKQSGSMKNIADITMGSLEVQRAFNGQISSDAFNRLANILQFKVGKDASDTKNYVTEFYDKFGSTDLMLSLSKASDGFIELYDEMSKFGGTAEQATNRVFTFGNLVSKGAMSFRDLLSGTQAARGMSTSGMVGLVELFKRFGIDTSKMGITSGMTPFQIEHQGKLFAENQQADWLKMRMQLVIAMAQRAGEDTPEGQRRFIQGPLKNLVDIPELDNLPANRTKEFFAAASKGLDISKYTGKSNISERAEEMAILTGDTPFGMLSREVANLLSKEGSFAAINNLNSIMRPENTLKAITEGLSNVVLNVITNITVDKEGKKVNEQAAKMSVENSKLSNSVSK